MGIEPFLVSSVMLLAIAQRLVRRVCKYCRKTYQPPQSALEYWELDQVENANFLRGTGCFNCMDKGYKGRTGIYEVLVIDEMVQDMILIKKTAQEITRATQQAGKLSTLREDAAQKILDGITTIEEATSAIMV
jgi:type IV pilus assembly protein PilB